MQKRSITQTVSGLLITLTLLTGCIVIHVPEPPDFEGILNDSRNDTGNTEFARLKDRYAIQQNTSMLECVFEELFKANAASSTDIVWNLPWDLAAFDTPEIGLISLPPANLGLGSAVTAANQQPHETAAVLSYLMASRLVQQDKVAAVLPPLVLLLPYTEPNTKINTEANGDTDSDQAQSGDYDTQRVRQNLFLFLQQSQLERIDQRAIDLLRTSGFGTRHYAAMLQGLHDLPSYWLPFYRARMQALDAMNSNHTPVNNQACDDLAS